MPRRVLTLAASITCLSGAAGLAHELLWTRRLVDLLGASNESTARVLGAFFLGLSLGAALSVRIVARTAQLWRAVALAEGAIAIAALPVLFLTRWTGWFWPWIGPDRLVSAGGLIKFCVSFAVVLPPATGMGVVLPLLVRAVLTTTGTLEREGVVLYAANTLGGVLGLGLTLVLLPGIGIQGGGAMAVGANVLAGALAYALHRARGFGAKPRTPPDRGQVAGSRPPGWLLAVSAMSGAGVLGLEVCSMTLVSQIIPASLFGTTGVLAVTLALLAVAGFLTPALTRRFGSPGELIAVAALLTGLWVALAPRLFVIFTGGLAPLGTHASVVGFLGALAAKVLVAFGPALFLAGLVFPLAIAAQGEGGDERGGHLGWMLMANGIGGLVGAEVAHRWLPERFGLYGPFIAVACLYPGIGLLVATSVPREARRRALIAPLGAAAVVVFYLRPIVARLPTLWAGRQYELVAEYSGREGIVDVVTSDLKGRGIVSNNGYYLGGTAALGEEARQGQLPVMLHPNPERVLFLGLATGLTASAALEVEGVGQVTAVELSELVVRASREHFSGEAFAIHHDARARVLVEDARTFVAAHEAALDVISADLFLPWRSGVGRLYSAEHFAAAKRALRPGGLFVQWLPQFQITRAQWESILATLHGAFPTVYLFRGNFTVAAPIVALVAPRDGALDYDGIRARIATAEHLKDPLLRSEAALGLLFMGESRRAPDAPLNTLGNAWLEFDAGRNRIVRAAPTLRFGRWEDFERRVADRNAIEEPLSDALRRGMRGGRVVANAPRNRKLTDGERSAIVSELRDAIPRELRDDAGADWDRAPQLAKVLRWAHLLK